MAIKTDRLLTPAEVAGLFRVDPKTVRLWAKKGKVARVDTLGGHGRYRQAQVRALLIKNGAAAAEADALIAAVLKKPRRPTRAREALSQPSDARRAQQSESC